MSPKYFQKQYLLLIIASTVIAFAITFSLYTKDYFQWTDNFIYDFNTHLRGPEPGSSDVTLVLIDEKSSSELKRTKGTLFRTQLDQSLQNLCAAGAEIIGLDIVLAVPASDKTVDESLSQTFYECNNVVLARVSSARGVSDIPPLPIFQDGMIGDGFIDVTLDQDEVMRRLRFLNAKPLADGNLMLLPSFSLEISRAFLDIEFIFDFSNENSIIMGKQGYTQIKLPYPELIIKYGGDYKNFTNLSFADVVNNRFNHDLIKGKIVLIGSNLAAQRDFYITPFTRFERATIKHQNKFREIVKDSSQLKDLGVSCHAWAVSNILNQQFIRQIPRKTIYQIVFLLTLLGIIFYIPVVQLLISSFFFLLAVTSVLGVSHFLFVKKLIWLDITPFLFVITIQFVGGTFLQRYYQRKKTEQVINLFGRYVSPQVVQELVLDDTKTTLSGHRQEVSIFFSDIRNFTSFSENLGAENTGVLLNTYFDSMIPIIFKHNGTLDKLIGDAMMAFYGAPVPDQNHPVKAATTALNMISALNELKTKDVKGIDKIDIGIGINTGEVTIGNLGSKNFMDYTVVGDSVNLAARLEGLNKIYGTKIIVSEFTATHLHNEFVMRQLDTVKVKGKTKVVTIFELVGFKGTIEENELELISLFNQALSFYKKQQWERAEELLREVQYISPEDGPAKLYLERIADLKNSSLPADWDGRYKFEVK